MATTSGYISAREVILDAAQAAGDPSQGIVGRPRYLTFAQQGLQKICQDTQFETRDYDVEIPENRIVPLPKWMAGMNGVWAYNGDRCNPLGIVNVYEKTGYWHDGGGGSFSHSPWNAFDDAMQMGANGGVAGPFYGQEPWNLRYYGIRGRQMCLSPQCTGYAYLRISYAGLGFDEFCGDTDIEIPMWARQAVTDYITMRAVTIRQYEEGKTTLMRAILNDMKEQMTEYHGSWAQAMLYWGGMDRKDRQDTVLYISKLGVGGEHL